MKTTIRTSTFETNSSSVHALVIGDSGNLHDYTDQLYINLGCYGLLDEIVDPINYVITAACCQDEYDKWRDRIEDVCGITVWPENPDGDYYIDHVDELFDDDGFMTMLEEDDELLRRFILDKDSFVETGNDDEYGLPEVYKHPHNLPHTSKMYTK